MARKPESSPPNRKQNRSNGYLQYAGLAFQLLVTIGISGWVGHKLDQWLHLKYPVMLVVLVLGGFAGSMYKLYRSFNRQ